VRFLSRVVKSCDHRHFFRFVGKNNTDKHSKELLQELAASPWSLLLIDCEGRRLEGPEAIPFILKNLPSGRLACVAYLIPGTMWLTKQLYFGISKNRKKIATLSISSSKTGSDKHAA